MARNIPIYTIENLRSSEPATREFDMFRFKYFMKDIQQLKSSHRHQFYTVIVITEGGGAHQIDFKHYELLPGRIFLIAPGQVHAWSTIKNTKGFVVLFNDTFIALSKGRKMMSSWPLFRAHQRCYFDLTPVDLKYWISELERMESETTLLDEFSRDALFFSTCSLLVKASRLSKKVNKSSAHEQDILYQFQELIEQHFIEMKTPSDYADLLNITANYLNAYCKEKSGKSAGQLIRQRVLLEAKRLLAHTSLSVAEIGYKLNFEDNSYFGKFFKGNSGMTPLEFRQRQNQQTVQLKK